MKTRVVMDGPRAWSVGPPFLTGSYTFLPGVPMEVSDADAATLTAKDSARMLNGRSFKRTSAEAPIPDKTLPQATDEQAGAQMAENAPTHVASPADGGKPGSIPAKSN